MYVCMYGHTYSKSMDQPGKVARPARGQLNRRKKNSLSAFVPESLVSRDGFGSPVPRQPVHLHTQAESGAYLRDSSQVPRRRPLFIYNRHTPSGQSRVYRVTQLRTDGVHQRTLGSERHRYANVRPYKFGTNQLAVDDIRAHLHGKRHKSRE